MRNVIGNTLIVLAAVAFVAMVVFACLAIWTVGSNADRWTSMGGLSLGVAFVLGMIGFGTRFA